MATVMVGRRGQIPEILRQQAQQDFHNTMNKQKRGSKVASNLELLSTEMVHILTFLKTYLFVGENK